MNARSEILADLEPRAFDCWNDEDMKVAGPLATQIQLLLMDLSEYEMVYRSLGGACRDKFLQSFVERARAIKRRCQELHREEW